MTHPARFFTRLMTGMGLAALLVAIMAAPAVAADTTISVTIIGGPRTVTIDPDFITSDVTYSQEPQSISGSATITVDDLSGTGDGWHVTLQATDLIHSGPGSGSSIPAKYLAVTSAGTPVMIAGQPIDMFGGPRAPDAATGSLDQPRNVLQANPEYGQGNYTQVLDLTLTIPAMSLSGSYGGALIVSIAAGP